MPTTHTPVSRISPSARHSGPPAASPRRFRYKKALSAAVFVILLAAVGVLGTCLALERRSRSSLDERLAAMEQQLSRQQSALDENASCLQQQEEQLSRQESTLRDQENTIREQDSTIDRQRETIDELNRQLVIKKNAAAQADTRKLVALTFDDGPGPYTGKLLDAMKARDVRATFFVLGSRVEQYPDLIRRMEAEGHVLGNHSQSHKNLKYLSAEQVRSDMEACADKLRALTGHAPAVMRCPGGNCNDTVLAYAKQAQIPVIRWSVDTRDWESRNVSKILATAFQSGPYGIRDGAIVLMHDIYSTSVDAAIQIMDRLQQQGYTMVTVPELLQLRYGEITAGKEYSRAPRQ